MSSSIKQSDLAHNKRKRPKWLQSEFVDQKNKMKEKVVPSSKAYSRKKFKKIDDC